MAWLFSKKNKHLPGEDLAYELSDDGSYYTVTGMGSCKELDLTVPSEFSGKPVRVIGKEAFADTKIKSIIISEGIEEICYEAFFSCKNLKSITLPSTLKKINDWAFNGKVLKKVIIPSALRWEKEALQSSRCRQDNQRSVLPRRSRGRFADKLICILSMRMAEGNIYPRFG